MDILHIMNFPQEAEKRISELESEVERLKQKCSGLEDKCLDQEGRYREHLDKLRKALEKIRDEEGKVCAKYETCNHTACRSSYHSWVIADRALTATS